MIDLQPFCSIDECRTPIMTPFVKDGWEYATDGEGLIMSARKESV